MRPFLTLLVGLATLLATPVVAAAATSGSAAYADQLQLLQTRVAEIAPQVPADRFPIGSGSDGEVRLAQGSDWNSGFWAGTLWRIYDLTKTSAAKSDALQATIDHFGNERMLYHDLGFMYGESSVAAYQRLCAGTDVPECSRLKKSGLTAAQSLLKLSRTTGQRIIPMSTRRCSDCARGGAETIVDSMMNLPLLYWASDVTGNRSYRNLALRHANWVTKNLERRDGSTYQAASYSRRAKRPRIRRHTHQGFSNSSVWARGQSWSIYGFALAGTEFKSRKFLHVAEQNAAYVERHLPATDVPPWDYRAGSKAPRDVSAGVIAAAGLFHLAEACDDIEGACRSEDRWEALARRILTGSLARIRTSNPTGYLGDMVYKMGSRDRWDHNAELTMGLDYALEAIGLARD